MSAFEAAALVTTVALCGIGPLALAVALGRRLRVSAAVVAIAACCHLLNIVIQLPILDALAGISSLLGIAIAHSGVYGVTEELVRYTSWYGRAMRRNRTSDGAVVAGLAWGGTESLLFTAQLALRAFTAPPGVSIGVSIDMLAAFALGRLFAIAGHIGFAHLSVLAHRRSKAWLPVVIVAHVAVDASVFGLMAILGPSSPLPTILFGLITVGSLVMVTRLRRSLAAASTPVLPRDRIRTQH